MSNISLLAVIISFAISAILGPVFIPILHRLKFGQTVRDDGPQSHLKKNGTPTMGGIIFLIAIIVTTLIFAKNSPKVLPVLLVTVGYGIIGFLDDYIKVVKKRSMGLNEKQKMLLQIVVTAAFAFYMIKFDSAGLSLRIPFTGGFSIDLGIFGIILFFIAVIGTANGANFTDGLDGLHSSVTVVIAIFFGIMSILTNTGIEAMAFAVVGGLMGFLLYNVYPAKIFMGDTGSLALGGFVAASAYMMNMPIYLILVAFIYFAEVLSVIIQVSYFKATGGKRIFKMAPIHHHFELCGWSETRVVAVFTIVTALLCIVAYFGY